MTNHEQVYGVVDEAAHKAAGGLPVVRVAQALIKAPIEDVALCWWQAGRRKVRVDELQICARATEPAVPNMCIFILDVGDRVDSCAGLGHLQRRDRSPARKLGHVSICSFRCFKDASNYIWKHLLSHVSRDVPGGLWRIAYGEGSVHWTR